MFGHIFSPIFRAVAYTAAISIGILSISFSSVASSQRDPYEVLGVSSSDGMDTIKKAWRKLIKLNHPDLNPHKDTTEDLKEINLAWDWIQEHPGQQASGTSQTEASAWKSHYDTRAGQEWNEHWSSVFGQRKYSDSTDLSFRLSPYVFLISQIYSSEEGHILYVKNPKGEHDDKYRLPEWYWLPKGSFKMYAIVLEHSSSGRFFAGDVLGIKTRLYEPRSIKVFEDFVIKEKTPDILKVGPLNFRKLSPTEVQRKAEDIYRIRPDIIMQEQLYRNTWTYKVYKDVSDPEAYIVLAHSEDRLLTGDYYQSTYRFWMGRPQNMEEYPAKSLEKYPDSHYVEINDSIFSHPTINGRDTRTLRSNSGDLQGWLNVGCKLHDFEVFNQLDERGNIVHAGGMQVVGRKLTELEYRNLNLSDLLTEEQLPEVTKISTPLDSLYAATSIGSSGHHPLFGKPKSCEILIEEKN